MEAQENSTIRIDFEKMTLSEKANDPTKEIQLFSKQSKQTCRHPYVFCRICGRYGRKDQLKIFHFKDHVWGPASRLGFVLNGDEPKIDKYGDFHQYQVHYGLKTTPLEQVSPLEQIDLKDQLECQRYYWNKHQKSAEKQNQEGIDTLEFQEKEKPQTAKKIKKSRSTPQGSRPSSKKVKVTPQMPEIKVTPESITKKTFGTFKKLCGMRSKDMSKIMKLNQIKSLTKLVMKKKVSLNKVKQKSCKTLKVATNPGSTQKPRELKNLDLWHFVKGPSKRIQKDKNIKVYALTRQSTGQQPPQSTQIQQRNPSQKGSRHKWGSFIQKLRVRQRANKQRELRDHFRDKYIHSVELNRQEILDLNEEHKQFMLRERQKHCHLYNQSANFQSTQHKLDQQMECTKLQREEIIILLTRLAKYAPKEVSEYPQNLKVGEKLDPHIWKLTRKAATDECLIQKLEQTLELKVKEVQEISKENLDFKSQIVYASNHLKMITDASKLVIQNLLQVQQQTAQMNDQINFVPINQQRVEPAFVPDHETSEEEFESFREEVQSDFESSSVQSSGQISSLVKQVSFCDTESIVGRKWINPQYPKSTRDQQSKRKAKQQMHKKQKIERIRQLYINSTNSSHPQLVSDQSPAVNQVSSSFRQQPRQTEADQIPKDFVNSRIKKP